MTLLHLPRPEPLSATDQSAYAQLPSGCVVIPAAVRWLDLAGEKATDALNGLVTNDVSALADGGSMRAVALTPKGKVLADLTIVRQSRTQLSLIMDAASAEAFVAMARKYVNPRLAALRDVSADGQCWWVIGAEVSALPALPDGVTSVARDDVGPYPALLLRAPIGDAGSTAGSAAAWLANVGSPGSSALLELLRIEAGQPAFGIDMDDTTIPQEANLDTLGAISFTKGCYTGQETVARVHFRGHVNRHLRGLRAATPLPGGAVVMDQEGKPIGEVRSTACSPTFGAIALGMIRREVETGAIVRIQLATEVSSEASGGLIEATVTQLPFGGS